MNDSNFSKCDVYVTVAISEAGTEKCCIANSNWIQQQRAHKQFMDDLRNDKQLWTTKTVKVSIQLPCTFEDLSNDQV